MLRSSKSIEGIACWIDWSQRTFITSCGLKPRSPFIAAIFTPLPLLDALSLVNVKDFLVVLTGVEASLKLRGRRDSGVSMRVEPERVFIFYIMTGVPFFCEVLYLS